ncbi:MAG TPA: hypothetical protein VKD91_17730 [Pyrinomonadaceae bacterium]|nr:hypothetical protein [Pyrinomonadaceae bacterium]
MHFSNDEEIRDLVWAFETCAIHPGEFKHYQHLAVALWYVKHFPYAEASEKMRTGIQRLAAAYGKTGYHETITLFWLKMVRSFLENGNSRAKIFTLANKLASEYGKGAIAEYYSEELLSSTKAKNEWVEPDLKSVKEMPTRLPNCER